MKNLHKGDYGYIKSYKKRKLITALILLAMIAFIIITLIIMYGDTSRVGVVFAILLSLPFAKYLIAYIMVIKFDSMDAGNYSMIDAALGSEQLIFDMVISKYEGMRFYYVMCVKNGWVYALVPEKGYDELKRDYSVWIKDTVNDGKYEYKVGVYKNADEFCRKVSNAGTPNDKNKIIDKYIKERLLEMGV